MSFFLPNKLNPQGRRLLTIIIAVPVFVSTSYILYKRGEQPHKAPKHYQIGTTSDLLAQYEEMDKERTRKE
ncbi:hypothetical protein BGX31_002098 [Mortierella sp. GBA43]|nr:hypothetical protein BGX31_002098 [Mortierella sp. GBA43]